jgi:hypothetical protein
LNQVAKKRGKLLAYRNLIFFAGYPFAQVRATINVVEHLPRHHPSLGEIEHGIGDVLDLDWDFKTS